jgi:MoaA/NifB/PqqE/SkfB family radical SAM enzyme
MAEGIETAYRRVYEGVNFRMRSLAGGRFAQYCRPTWISFLLTERCNARCVHCDIWKNKGREDTPTPEHWARALSEIRDWLGPVHICLTGGEALLRPYTVDLIAHGSRLGLQMELLTHGWWKDQSRIEAAARANPWRVTLSFDGVGEVHDKVRGREGFFDRTHTTIETLKRIRREEGMNYSIRLKTVVMSHNLHNLGEVTKYATQEGVDVLFQAVEQNYNTESQSEWWLHTDNWPTDSEEAVAAVENLIALKREGYHIANTMERLEVMIPYFRDPGTWTEKIRSHTAHERRSACAALGLLQVNANGDVLVCYEKGPVGNLEESTIREIWENRPQFWESGCCQEQWASSEPELVTLERAVG